MTDERQRRSAQREDRRERRLLGDPSAEEQRRHDQHETERGGLEHAARTDPSQIHTHQHGDRDRQSDRHGSPWARFERVDDDERQHREQHDHDAEHRDQRRDAGDRPDLLARHLPERLAVAADGRCENDKILNRTAERDADDDPDDAGQISELRGQRWSDERTRAGDRREVVAEDHPPVRRDKVASVIETDGRSRPPGVEREDLRRDQLAVKPIRDGVGTDSGGE